MSAGKMLFPEEDAPLLKAWIVKRLEKSSNGDNDVDPDVLADYVLALLRHDGDPQEARKVCEAELPLFLQDDTLPFIVDVFHAIQYRSYAPGAAPPPPPRIPSEVAQGPGPAPAAASNTDALLSMVPPGTAGMAQNVSRKRTYQETDDVNMINAYPYGSTTRAFKQARRGFGGRGDRIDDGGADSFRGGDNAGRPSGDAFQPGPGPGSDAGLGRGGLLPFAPQAPPGDMPGFEPIRPNFEPMFNMQQQSRMGMPLPAPVFSGTAHFSGGPRGGSGSQRRPRQSKKRCRDYDTKGICTRNNCPYQHIPATEPPQQQQQPQADEYDPRNALMSLGDDVNGQAVNRLRPGFHVSEPPQGLPNTWKLRGRPGGRGGRGRSQSPLLSRKGRAPFSAEGPVHDRSKSTVVIENIPEEHFSEKEIRDFFAPFGKIEEVSMHSYKSAHSSKRLATVRFEDWAAANAAYRSPKVIFDNRFVKVFWYKDEASLLPVGAVPSGQASGGAAATAAAEDNSVMAAENEPEIDMAEFLQRQEEAQRQHEEKMQKKVELDRQRQELEKRQRELLAKQQEEKQKLYAKLAATTSSPSSGKAGRDRSLSPEVTFSTLGGDAGATVPSTPSKPTSQAEALRAQLAALEEEAKQLGIDPDAMDEELSMYSWTPGGGRGRGRGGYYRARGYSPRGYPYRGGGYSYRGRGGYAPGGGSVGGSANSVVAAAYAAYTLDNRPRKVAVSGVDFTSGERDEALRQYLLANGDFEDIETTPRATHITFKDRRTAEKFYYGLTASRNIPGVEGQVELSWVTGGPSTPKTSMLRSVSDATGAAATKASTGAAAAASATTATTPASAGGGNVFKGADANGDALMHTIGGEGEGGGESHANTTATTETRREQEAQMDFDVADENDWGIQ